MSKISTLGEQLYPERSNISSNSNITPFPCRSESYVMIFCPWWWKCLTTMTGWFRRMSSFLPVWMYRRWWLYQDEINHSTDDCRSLSQWQRCGVNPTTLKFWKPPYRVPNIISAVEGAIIICPESCSSPTYQKTRFIRKFESSDIILHVFADNIEQNRGGISL